MSVSADSGSGGFDFGIASPTEELSENVVEDLVEYSRGNVVRNEGQSILLFCSWISGWFAREERYNNTVVIGTTGSGKTHVVNEMKPLIDQYAYESTSGSDKAFVDDDTWADHRVAVLSEFQKLPSEVVEFMKSVAGDDGGYTYSRNVPDEDGPKGARKTVKTEKEAKPFSFTYAQFDMDNEMWTRLFKAYVEESEVVNRAVSRKHAGHENITMDGAFDREYVYDTSDLERALKRHVRELPTDAYVKMPEWVFYAVEPTLNMSRSETKRVSAMVFNFIRASALLNYRNRPTTTKAVDGSEVEAYVVTPQDVANILSAREVLLGTTHELEPRKMKVVEAVREQSRMGDEQWCLLEDIQSYFQTEKSDMSLLKKDQLRDILKQLDENFIVKEHERVDGNAHGYEFLNLSQLGHPRLHGLDDFAQYDYNEDDPFVGVDDPSDPFTDTIDPFEDRPFKATVEAFRERVSETVEAQTSAASAMGGDSDRDDAAQATLGGDTTETEYTIENPVEASVYEQLCELADGRTVRTDDELVAVFGVDPTTDVSGTVLDPSHEMWRVQNRDESIVSDESDAEGELEEHVTRLQNEGVVSFEPESGDDVRVSVSDNVSVEV